MHRVRPTAIAPPLALLLAATALAGCASTGSADVTPTPAPADYALSWSDEFDGPDGSAPDATKWTAEVNANGGGNNELQYYTARPTNVHVQGGQLVITGRRERYTGPDGTREYTSARLTTTPSFQQVYGRFEASLKLPRGQGVWPAFWLLGQNVGQVGWPACGEIDIMENVGFEPATVHATIHGPGYSGAHGISSGYSLPSSAFADAFHQFAAEWEPGQIRFYVDGNLYATRTPADLPAGRAWVLDGHPFTVILNLALGGNWPGSPDATTEFPQTLLVDYVRIYDRAVH